MRLILPVLCLLFAIEGNTAGATEQWHPLEMADTSSPRATLVSFTDSCNAIYRSIEKGIVIRGGRSSPEAAAQVYRMLACLDLSKEAAYLQERSGAEAALCLKEVLDRIPLPPRDEIPGTEEIEAAGETGGLECWRISHTPITISIMKEGPRQGEYLFSDDTVQHAREYYDRVKALPYKRDTTKGLYQWYLSEPGWMLSPLVHRFPAWTRTRIGGQAVWQWSGLGLTVLLAIMVMLIAYRMGRSRSEMLRKIGAIRYTITLWFPIAAMLVPLLAKKFIVDQVIISGATLAIVSFAANVVFLITVIILLVSVGNRVAEILIASPKIHPRGLDAQFIRIVSRVLSLGAATIVLLEGGQYLGIPLTTLLAGAGVGGLALALAAQDTLKNLFGSMMIILDKPYRVGERIVVKGYDGIVAEIGLRSTKIRLLTGHVTSIPNEEMARSDIENIGRRLHIRRNADIRLPLDTTSEKTQQAVDIVRELMADHEGLNPEYPPRIYFDKFNRDSLNLRMIYWYYPPNYWDFLAFSEKLNLEIKRRLEAAGIELALPATTTFMAQDETRPLELHVRSD